MSFTQTVNGVEAYVSFIKDNNKTTLHAEGNGSLDAVSNALKSYTGKDYKLKVYTEHSMQRQSSQSTAAAYIGLELSDGTVTWGAGTDTDIIRASINALISAYNNSFND